MVKPSKFLHLYILEPGTWRIVRVGLANPDPRIQATDQEKSALGAAICRFNMSGVTDLSTATPVDANQASF